MKSKKTTFATALGALLLVGCSEQDSPRPPLPDEVPLSVHVSGGSMTAGFAAGKSREEKSFTNFKITQSPITVAQYKQCVAVGACALPKPQSPTCENDVYVGNVHVSSLDGRTFGVDDALPMTCLMPEQAIGYCHWQGGTLPSLTEWTVASRGGSVHRYAWGDRQATCDEHPGVDRSSGKVPCVSSLTAFRVGAHPAGASPMGVQDVLITRTELLRDADDAQFSSCRGNSTCAVIGTFAGTIDSVRPVSSPHDLGPSFGFRCVTQEGGR